MPYESWMKSVLSERRTVQNCFDILQTSFFFPPNLEQAAQPLGSETEQEPQWLLVTGLPCAFRMIQISSKTSRHLACLPLSRPTSGHSWASPIPCPDRTLSHPSLTCSEPRASQTWLPHSSSLQSNLSTSESILHCSYSVGPTPAPLAPPHTTSSCWDS